jgi:hypothetical protein
LGISVGNFNLGVFSLLLIFFLATTYYTSPEKEYFVWIYKLTPRGFLIDKIKTALWFSTLLCLPVTIALCFFFLKNIHIVLGLQVLCYLYLATMILAKYSRFPGQVNLPEIGIMALSIWFPPILLGIIPYFYIKSVKRLQEIL